MGPENETAVTEFILEGFSGLDRRLQLFLSLVLLLIYLTTVMGNATIIFLVCVDHRLQTPMDFFISNLSLLEIWFTSSTSIKLFLILGSGRRTISLSGCFAQSYFYFALGCTEFVLLVVTSFDRYVAICQPLRYAAIMKPQPCIQLVVAAWVIGITLLSYRLVFIYQLNFCGSNKIYHFFCDSSPLFRLSCSDTSLLWKIDSGLVSFVILTSLCLTLAFYTGILLCILHLPATLGRKKAFTTCSSHLTSLAIAYGSSIALYMHHSEDASLETNRIVALLNTVLYPFLNPFIYSLRNKAVIAALSEAIGRATLQIFP
ncbi:LOW QUALITY PROTEIN: olfactory receptor 49-like [Tyto alba]|uniref:LOW QUALITY PROTEIN: olfactory receptor 49-like n=1 Tax=Tyto alba TaxID=56313 RepID=UPI001C667C9C|nr:LOW QUALITY PROTEIN: olfactory receptor 49-like [Tyto alba]XP_042655207.1 LOW QUALITY PROTEIN: olfactory receptor 49-like [Tyto alba]